MEQEKSTIQIYFNGAIADSIKIEQLLRVYWSMTATERRVFDHIKDNKEFERKFSTNSTS